VFVWTLRESKHSFAFINRHKLLKSLKALLISIENQIPAIRCKVIRYETKITFKINLFLVFVGFLNYEFHDNVNEPFKD